jgi:hypothetical protein
LWWKFKGSIALILLLAFASGVLASFFTSLPTFFRKNKRIRQLKKALKSNNIPDPQRKEEQKETGTDSSS